MKEHVEKYDTVDLNGVKCPIISAGPTAQNVLIYHFPFEEDNSRLQAYLSPFGKVLSVRLQHYPSLQDISTGTRIVRMVREQPIPRNLTIGSHRVKCWYVGQPIECDICRGAHVAKDCALRGKCRNCKQDGHMARDCPNPPQAWGVAPAPSLIPTPQPALPHPTPPPLPRILPLGQAPLLFLLWRLARRPLLLMTLTPWHHSSPPFPRSLVRVVGGP